MTPLSRREPRGRSRTSPGTGAFRGAKRDPRLFRAGASCPEWNWIGHPISGEAPMDTDLNDAAFRLVSHSLLSIDANLHAMTDEAWVDALRRQFPGRASREITEALALAQRVEQTALEMANAFRGSADSRKGPPLTREALAEQCPGFSETSYGWAVNDGFIRTRT